MNKSKKLTRKAQAHVIFIVCSVLVIIYTILSGILHMHGWYVLVPSLAFTYLFVSLWESFMRKTRRA